jgi:hypothetical protein
MQQASGARLNGSLWPLSGRVQVLDEDDFVSQFVVDELVDGAGGEQKAITSSAHALLVTSYDVGRGVVGGVGVDCMGDVFLAESGAWIAYPKGHGAGSTDGVHFDDLIGIELGAVLHCVDEDLAERQHDVLACGLGQLRGKLSGKGHETVGSGEAAVDSEGDPAGACREDFNIFVRLVAGSCVACDAGDLVRVEGRSEASEDARAKSGDDLVRCAVRGENDALEIGPNDAHLLEEGEGFFDGAVGAGDDDTECAGAELVEGIDMPGGILEREIGGGEEFTDLAADRGLTVDDKNSAHGAFQGNGLILDQDNDSYEHDEEVKSAK